MEKILGTTRRNPLHVAGGCIDCTGGVIGYRFRNFNNAHLHPLSLSVPFSPIHPILRVSPFDQRARTAKTHAH